LGWGGGGGGHGGKKIPAGDVGTQLSRNESPNLWQWLTTKNVLVHTQPHPLGGTCLTRGGRAFMHIEMAKTSEQNGKEEIQAERTPV